MRDPVRGGPWVNLPLRCLNSVLTDRWSQYDAHLFICSSLYFVQFTSKYSSSDWIVSATSFISHQPNPQHLHRCQSLQESCNSSWSRRHKPTQPKWKSVEALDFGSLPAVGRQLHNVRLWPIHSLSNYSQIYQRHTKQISRPNMLNNQISGCYSSILSLCAQNVLSMSYRNNDICTALYIQP